MGVLDDVWNALDRIPIWKRLQEVPDEVDDLKKRVADLEEKLNGKWPAEVCRYCGERATRLSMSVGPTDKGAMREEWLCASCGQTDVRLTKPS